MRSPLPDRSMHLLCEWELARSRYIFSRVFWKSAYDLMQRPQATRTRHATIELPQRLSQPCEAHCALA